MNRRIISLLRYLKPHGLLAVALSCFFQALVLLLFRLHDLGLLAGLYAALFLFIGSFYLWAYLYYLLRLQKH